jgi:hypothetical protein
MSEKGRGPSAEASGTSLETKAQVKDAHEKQIAAAQKISAETKKSHDAAQAAVAAAPAATSAQGTNDKESSGGFMEKWGEDIARPWKEKPLPGLPALSTIGKGAALGAAVALPTLAIPAAGAFVVGRGVWRQAVKIPPFRWIDKGVRAGVSTVGEGVSSIGKMAAYPFRLGGRLALNTLRSGKALIVDPMREGINDLEAAINAKYFKDSKEHINLISSALFGIKSLAIKLGYELPAYIIKQLIDHPARTIIVGGLATGLLANAGWNPVLASTKLVNGVGEFFQWLTGSAAIGAPAAAAGGSSWLPSWLPFIK